MHSVFPHFLHHPGRGDSRKHENASDDSNDEHRSLAFSPQDTGLLSQPAWHTDSHKRCNEGSIKGPSRTCVKLLTHRSVQSVYTANRTTHTVTNTVVLSETGFTTSGVT